MAVSKRVGRFEMVQTVSKRVGPTSKRVESFQNGMAVSKQKDRFEMVWTVWKRVLYHGQGLELARPCRASSTF